ncbi:MAG: DUF402 domain-containing protein [Acidimicrobiales bacterium]
MTWAAGDVIVRREVWQGRPWFANPQHVIADDGEVLVTFQPVGAPFGFGEGADWPTPTGLHPYDGRTHWVGEGVLGLQRAGDPYAVWHHWSGPERSFTCWYVNIQAPLARTPIGFDSLDLELDLIAFPSGEVVLKDEEQVAASAALGRFSPDTVPAIHALGRHLSDDLEAGRRWWGDDWLGWVPEPHLLEPPPLPDDWAHTPALDRRDLDLL